VPESVGYPINPNSLSIGFNALDEVVRFEPHSTPIRFSRFVTRPGVRSKGYWLLVLHERTQLLRKEGDKLKTRLFTSPFSLTPPW